MAILHRLVKTVMTYELNLEIHEDPKKRKGLASYSIVFSTSCNSESKFITSERIGCFSEVNRTFIRENTYENN